MSVIKFDLLIRVFSGAIEISNQHYSFGFESVLKKNHLNASCCTLLVHVNQHFSMR